MATNLAKNQKWILGDKFDERMPHHDGIKALWETKWKLPVSFNNFRVCSRLTSSQCSKSVYPFHDGKLEDFEGIFENLILVSPQLLG